LAQQGSQPIDGVIQSCAVFGAERPPLELAGFFLSALHRRRKHLSPVQRWNGVSLERLGCLSNGCRPRSHGAARGIDLLLG
jgi:hypothetical protein